MSEENQEQIQKIELVDDQVVSIVLKRKNLTKIGFALLVFYFVILTGTLIPTFTVVTSFYEMPRLAVSSDIEELKRMRDDDWLSFSNEVIEFKRSELSKFNRERIETLYEQEKVEESNRSEEVKDALIKSYRKQVQILDKEIDRVASTIASWEDRQRIIMEKRGSN